MVGGGWIHSSHRTTQKLGSWRQQGQWWGQKLQGWCQRSPGSVASPPRLLTTLQPGSCPAAVMADPGRLSSGLLNQGAPRLSDTGLGERWGETLSQEPGRQRGKCIYTRRTSGGSPSRQTYQSVWQVPAAKAQFIERKVAKSH